MRMINYEIQVNRNESFTLDFNVINVDGSPYIIDSRFKNPHVLITVSSMEYFQSKRYIRNWWLPLSEMPRFVNTQVLPVKDFDTKYPPYKPNGETYGKIEDFDEDYTGKIAVFSKTVDGVTEYRYYDIVSATYKPYSLRIIKTFTPTDTSEWIGQTYLYSIKIVSGELKNKDSDVPIDTFEDVTVILEPTKLIVLDDQNGGYML